MHSFKNIAILWCNNMASPERQPPYDIASLEPKERLLQGRNVLVTGSDRDIGAGIILAFAQEGANVILHHRDPQKGQRRARPVLDQIVQYGVNAQHVIADLTDSEQRQQLTSTVDAEFGGELDFLVLNASGPTRDLNVIGNNALITEMLPRMKKGGTIMLMQSTPGHFTRQITDIGMMPDVYGSVAASKNEAEQSLLARKKELQEKGISLVIVCPPEVSDTSNMRIFNAKTDGNFSQRNAALSQALGLPKNVTIDDVARKVVELSQRNDLPFGYVELFGDGVVDARSVLSQWYGDNAIFVDTVDIESGKGKLIVGPRHCEGHFNDEVGIQVFPGHVMVEAAAQTLGIAALARMQKQDGVVPVLEYTGTPSRIQRPLTPGDVMTIQTEITVISTKQVIGNALITNGDHNTLSLEGITFSMRKIEALKRAIK